MAKAPFRGTYFGTIAHVEPMKESQSGQSMKYFDLVDSAGYWIPFCAVAQHATSKALRVGNQVVVYFASGRSQIGEAKACVYLFKDAVIIMHRRAPTIPSKRIEIEIQ